MALLSNSDTLRVVLFVLLGLGCIGGIVAVALSDVLMKEIAFIFLGLGIVFFFGDATQVLINAYNVREYENQKNKPPKTFRPTEEQVQQTLDTYFGPPKKPTETPALLIPVGPGN